MALNFPSSPTVGDEFTGGGFTWTWTGTTWSKLAPASGANDFALLVGTSGNKTYVLDKTYQSGAYTVTFVNGDNTYDIYAIAEDGTYAGYTNNGRIDTTANFSEIVILGAANNERILFSYQGAITSPTTSGDVATAGAYITAVGTSSLPNANDTTTITGGNFATDVAVAFIGQDSNVLAAKSIVRSSSTSLIATRPDALTTAQSPYSVRVLNPGIAAPTGTNAHILSNAITAGTNPVWTTTSPVYYKLNSVATSLTFLATDTEASDIDYTVVSGTLPVGLSLDSETGVVSGTYSGSAVDGDTNVVTIRATDAGGNYLDRAFTFTANAAPTWTTASGALPDSIVNFAYSYQLQASTGLVGGSLTYSLQSGALPTGLSLSSSGLISGTNADTVNTTDSFTVRVTDAFSQFTDRAFTITTPPLPSASGGTVTSDATYYYHTFTGNGTFTVSGAPLVADVLMIAGGASGAGSISGYSASNGGGGAGGVLYTAGTTISPAGYSLVIGGGAAVNSYGYGHGNNGSDTTGFTRTAIGGGGGGTQYEKNAYNGGSGGGAGSNQTGMGSAGLGTAGQGNNGGRSASDYDYYGGGGGGAAGVGGSTGDGGAATSAYSTWASVTGTGVSGAYAGGGGGAGAYRSTTNGGGGGATGGKTNLSAGNATANTGSGGGCIWWDGNGGTKYAGNGGSGLVIVRYARSTVGG